MDSDLKILYENTTEMHHRQSTAKIVGQNAKGEYLFKLEKTIPWTTSTEIYPDFGFIMNSRVYGTKGSWAENNVTGTRAYVNSVVQLPKEGYDVHLGVHSGLIASRSRIQIIGHSIREKYYMQNFNMERDAAHDKSGQGNLTFWRIISK